MALESAAANARVLDTALNLAGKWGGDLRALLVEDVDLMRLAAFPFAREVGVATAISRPLQSSVLERTFRAEAARLQQILGRAAATRNIAWKLDVRRGRPLEEAVASGQGADVLVMGSSTTSISIGALTSAKPPREEVVALFDSSESAFRGLDAALALLNTHHDLTLLVPNEPSEVRAGHREQARSWMSQHGVAAQIAGLENSALQGLLAITQRRRIATIIVPFESARLDVAALRRLYMETTCPIILVK